MSTSTGQTAEPDFGSWGVPELPSTIEYPLEVMDEIRAYACDELPDMAHGSREVGGVLFGVRRESKIRILTWRPIVCEYADGDNLHLSPADALALAVQVERARTDPNLKSLKPVGWFVCHPRSSVSLSRSDREIYNGFFPEIWQIALVLHPSGGGAVRAGFFERELDGSVKADASYQEMVLQPLRTHSTTEPAVSMPGPGSAPAYVAETASARASAIVPEIVPEEIVNEPSPFTPPSFRISEPAPAHERWLWAVPIALALLLIGLALHHWQTTPPGTPGSLTKANQASTVRAEPAIEPIPATSSLAGSQAPTSTPAATSTQAPASTQAATTPPASTVDASQITELRAERDQLAAQIRQKDDALQKERARADQLQNLVRILENRLNFEGGRTTSSIK